MKNFIVGKVIFEEEGDNIELSPKQITEEEKLTLETPITKLELDNALKTLRNNKSPGPNGFSPEFYKYFWPELGYLFLFKMIQCWSSRNITSIGRITVCKSLLLSKITHILISLPTPSKGAMAISQTPLRILASLVVRSFRLYTFTAIYFLLYRDRRHCVKI